MPAQEETVGDQVSTKNEGPSSLFSSSAQGYRLGTGCCTIADAQQRTPRASRGRLELHAHSATRAGWETRSASCCGLQEIPRVCTRKGENETRERPRQVVLYCDSLCGARCPHGLIRIGQAHRCNGNRKNPCAGQADGLWTVRCSVGDAGCRGI